MEAPQRWGHVCSALYAWNLANGTHLIFEGINVSTAGNIYILKYIWGKGDCMTVVKGTDFQGTSLTVQWLRLYTPNVGGTGLIPGQGAKIPHAAQCSQ